MKRLGMIVLAFLIVVVGLAAPVAAVVVPRTVAAPPRYIVTGAKTYASSSTGCVTETQPIDAYSNPLHVHLWRVTQHMTWCWHKTKGYPLGRVYGIDIGATGWTNPATPWVYDGLLSVDQGYGRARFYYQTTREYGFHVCILWYCTHDYPWIEQVGMYGFVDGGSTITGYTCWYGFGNGDSTDCTFLSNPS